MRFVPTYCIVPGTRLGQTLYGTNGEVLLRDGTVMKESYIEKLCAQGYNGAYIDDDISKDIEIHEIISAELKNKTVKALKTMFIQIETNKATANTRAKDLAEMKELVESILNEITSTKDLMVNMLDIKIFDDYTFYHSTNVTVLSMVMGIAMNLKRNVIMQLGMAALFHDIGKVYISKDILNKNERLTEPEFSEIKEHSVRGYRHLKELLAVPPRTYVGVLQHHEKYDGSGYPNGVAGKDISLFGRIIALTDVYDALTSDRPYRKGLFPSEAMEYIMANGGLLFDHDLVKVFAQKVAPYPIGTYVFLSDGSEGLVVENYEECCLRPKIKIIKNKVKENVAPYHLNLKDDAQTYSITITGMDRGDEIIHSQLPLSQ